MRYVILGTGVAGISAIESIRSVDQSGEVVLIGDDPHAYYSRPGLAYYLTGELTENMLFPYRREDYARARIKYLRDKATAIDPAARTVSLQENGKVSFDRLLVAIGSQAAPLTTPGSNLEGVYKLDDLEDARRLRKAAQRARTAVVIGGGITSLELVEGLIANRVKVHYLMRAERYWGNVLDHDESHIVEDRLTHDGVSIQRQARVAEILGKRNKVVGVRLEDGRQIKCDLVCFAIGVKPRLEMARLAGLNLDRGILVDEKLRTNMPGVYAAGDIAQVFDPLTGQTSMDSLWTPAREQGLVAGRNMAGDDKVYQKSVPFNVTRLAGLTTTIIGAVGSGRDEDLVGIARGDSETWRSLPDATVAQTGFDVNRLRLLVGKTSSLGAVVMGDQTLSRPLQQLITAQADISPMRDRLLMPNAPIAELIANFWSSWRSQYA